MDGATATELAFTDQRHEFLDLVRQRYPDAPTSLDELLLESTRPLTPVLVGSLETVSSDELATIRSELDHGYGVVHILPSSFSRPQSRERHPVLAFADELRRAGVIGYAIDHPMEKHPEAQARFGPPDGTLKIYDLPMERDGPRYREVAETNEMFDAHNDGLGYAGLIRHVVFTLDSPPLTGGYTFFQNLVRAAPAIAAADPEAFKALFLPDAITATRPRGKGAIQVKAPVYYIGRDGAPQVFFRVDTGEYRMSWRAHPALARARAILGRLASPFGPHSRFVHLMRPGETVLIENQHLVHGRTPFVDPPGVIGRVLARKWFVSKAGDTAYRHVPALDVDSRWAALLPDEFSERRLNGDWNFDSAAGENVLVTP